MFELPAATIKNWVTQRHLQTFHMPTTNQFQKSTAAISN
jgi:hypothetical protein